MLKRIIYYFQGAFEDSPALVLTTILGFFIVFLLIVWSPIKAVVIREIPEATANFLFTIIFFSLFGIMGLVVLRYQEAPVFIIPMTGLAAKVFGLILLISSAGCIVLAIFNYLGHPLIK